jgi:hypothetical protein
MIVAWHPLSTETLASLTYPLQAVSAASLAGLELDLLGETEAYL